MKAIVEFNLPEENAEFYLAINADELAAAITNVDNLLRNGLKRGFEDGTTVERLAEQVRELLSDAKQFIQ